MTTPNLNGLTPGLALLQLLWSERPKRTAQMQQSGPKYLTLVEDTGGYVAPGRENTDGLPVAITDSMLIQHLQGDTTYAAPLIGADGLAKALVIEIDSGGQAAIQSVLDCAAAAGLTAFAFYVPANSNDSQHDGGHVWILYRDTWSPARLQEQSKQLLRAAGLPDDKEIHPGKSNIRLPFGYHLRKKTRGVLLLQNKTTFMLDKYVGLEAAVNAVSALPLNTLAPPPEPVVTPKTYYVDPLQSVGDVKPFDDFNARATDATTAALIGPKGWTHCGGKYYARPGKDPKNGHSATLGHVGPGWLTVFSENDPLLPGKAPEGIKYSAAKIYTILYHKGDSNAAARDLYAQGYGTRLGAQAAQPSPAPAPRQPQAQSATQLPLAQQPDRAFILECLKSDEAGDAELSAWLFKAKLAFGSKLKAWHIFGPHAWIRLDGAPRSMIWRNVAAAYLAQAAEEQLAPQPDKQFIDDLIKRAKHLRAAKRINNVLLLTTELLAIDDALFDADPWLLGVQNGIVDLRTGQLRDGRPEDFLTIVAPTMWRGLNEPAPDWQRFVSEIMSDDLDRAGFLHRLLGYAINGSTREHILSIFVGERGRNGKGTLFEVLKNVLGGYALTVSSDVFIGRDDHRQAGQAQPHLRDLQGARLAFASETDKDTKLSIAQIKTLTGGDSINARRLHENNVEFKPTHTLFLQSNHRPHAPADDSALWDRMRIIEFRERWPDVPELPTDRIPDKNLKARLQAESSGILAWLVRGGLEWQQNGLQTPASVRLARDSYRRGESIDPFLDDACIEVDDGQAEGGQLYTAYQNWCRANSLKPNSTVWFGKAMLAKFERGRSSATGRMVYHGVYLTKTSFAIPMPAAATPVAGSNPSDPSENPQTLQSASESQVSVNNESNPEGLRSIPMSNPMPPLMKGKTRGNPSNPSDPSGFNETDDLFCEKTDDSASLGVTVDPLAKVPWPSVREYLVQGNTQRIADFCRSLWRVEYDDVLVGAYQRWPELAPEVVEQPE